MTNIVKVRYGSDPKQGREYSYYTEDVLVIGDKVNVPTKNGTVKAIVTGINVQEYLFNMGIQDDGVRLNAIRNTQVRSQIFYILGKVNLCQT